MKSGHDDFMIHEIAEMAHVSEQEVLTEFQVTLASMVAKARIHDFLPLLAMNQVRRQYMASILAKREFNSCMPTRCSTAQGNYFESMTLIPIAPH